MGPAGANELHRLRLEFERMYATRTFLLFLHQSGSSFLRCARSLSGDAHERVESRYAMAWAESRSVGSASEESKMCTPLGEAWKMP